MPMRPPSPPPRAPTRAPPLGKAERDAASGSTEKRERSRFRVNVCGIPPVMRQNQAPWPVCRVWLVGCPGGAPCGFDPTIARTAWTRLYRYGVDPPSGHGALDPRRPLGVRTRHRRARARGRVRVHDRQAVVHGRAARRRGRRGDAYRDPTGRCEVRFDSGHPMGNHIRNPGRNEVTCWRGATGAGTTLGTLGTSTRASSFTPVTNSPTELARLGAGDAVCRSRSPTSPDSSLGQCVLRRTARDPANTFRRVLPSLTDERIMSGKSELINDGEEEGAGDRSSYRSMEFVWGTCDAAPRSASWCEAPAFDPAKVAAVCGVEYHVETAKETTGETDTARTGLRPVGGVVPAALEPPRLIEDDEPPTETETSEAETSAPAPAVVVPVATANGAAGRTKKDIFGTGGAESPPRSSRRGRGRNGGGDRGLERGRSVQSRGASRVERRGPVFWPARICRGRGSG